MAHNSPPRLLLQPWAPRLLEESLNQSGNFSEKTSIQALRIDNEGTSWLPLVTNDELDDLLATCDASPLVRGPHVMIILFVSLKRKDKGARYNWQANISSASFKHLVQCLGIHDAAAQNILGRPDYWSALGRRKTMDRHHAASYEFYCQHPRWSMRSHHEKTGPVAPCSVYLHHNAVSNTSYYVISSGKEEDSIACMLRDLGVPDRDVESTGPTIEAAANPFLVHALVSSYVYQNSIQYVMGVREKVFSEITDVNDYSREAHSHPVSEKVSPNNAGRVQLEAITKNLHLVSQTCDAGIANAEMSIRLCQEMVRIHAELCKCPVDAPDAWQQVHDSMTWVLKTWHCQKAWLISYKARKDTAMNFVYNLVTQQDNSLNIDIAHQATQHSSSMHSITILTMVFLPGTFVAGVFGSGILDNQNSHGPSDVLLPFIYLAIPLTLLTFAMWFWRRQLVKAGMLVLLSRGRQTRRDDPEMGMKKNIVPNNHKRQG